MIRVLGDHTTQLKGIIINHDKDHYSTTGLIASKRFFFFRGSYDFIWFQDTSPFRKHGHEIIWNSPETCRLLRIVWGMLQETLGVPPAVCATWGDAETATWAPTNDQGGIQWMARLEYLGYRWDIGDGKTPGKNPISGNFWTNPMYTQLVQLLRVKLVRGCYYFQTWGWIIFWFLKNWFFSETIRFTQALWRLFKHHRINQSQRRLGEKKQVKFTGSCLTSKKLENLSSQNIGLNKGNISFSPKLQGRY